MGRTRSLDLFCGIGGLTLGFHRAGFDSVGGIDCWDQAAATFEFNLPHRCMVADLRTVAVDEVETYFDVDRKEIDVLIGGPPCQGFSTVGKRDPADPRNLLWKRYLDVVSEIRPAYLVIENVEGMIVMHGGALCDEIQSGLAELGYRSKWRLLRAADYGVPQLRKRVFFLGWLDRLAEPAFPEAALGPPVSVADAIGDLPPLAAGESATEYRLAPTTEFQRRMRGASRILFNHEAARHPQRLVEIMSHVPDGGNRKSIPDRLQPKSGFHNSYSRLASDRPAVAVTSNMRKPSSARATHPTQHRGLTVREGLRLQTFPDEFRVLGSRTSQYLQVGNAVPPSLGEAVGREVSKAVFANSPDMIRRVRARPVRRAKGRKVVMNLVAADDPCTRSLE